MVIEAMADEKVRYATAARRSYEISGWWSWSRWSRITRFIARNISLSWALPGLCVSESNPLSTPCSRRADVQVFSLRTFTLRPRSLELCSASMTASTATEGTPTRENASLMTIGPICFE